MNNLSVVVITYNEEHNLSRCLESVAHIADEIVVVDSFSTDGTAKICNDFNVRFVQKEWAGFSEQKNFADSLASNDWIFSIDADEAVSPQLEKSILKQKTVGFSGCYYVNRLAFYCGKWIHHSGWYPDSKIRIWNKNQARWVGIIHEKLQFDTPTVPSQFLEGDLLHFSYSDIIDHLQRANRYTSLVASDYYEKGKKVSGFKMVFSPIFTFFRDFFLRQGFRDGRQGYVICKIAAFSTFLKYVKLWERYHQR